MPYPVGFILPICEISVYTKGYGEKVQAFSLFLWSLRLQRAIMYCIVVVSNEKSVYNSVESEV